MKPIAESLEIMAIGLHPFFILLYHLSSSRDKDWANGSLGKSWIRSPRLPYKEYIFLSGLEYISRLISMGRSIIHSFDI